jgi:hypothetical protein
MPKRPRPIRIEGDVAYVPLTKGCNAPRGWAVAYAVTRLPSAAKYLLEAA